MAVETTLVSNSYLDNNPAIPVATVPIAGRKYQLIMITDDAGNILNSFSVTPSGYSSVTEGQKDITLAANPEALAASQACKKVIIVAKESNTGTIWVKSTVTNNTLGRPLLALQSETFEVTNLNLLFLKATVDGEGVTFLAFN